MARRKLRREFPFSELIPTTWHLDVTWVMAYDLFPLETIENRKKYYKEALAGNWLTVFTHDPDIPWAYLESVKGKVAIRPEKLTGDPG